MIRTINYRILNTDSGILIKDYLRNKGYSARNLIELKKDTQSVLLNDTWARMNQPLKTGDLLQICITENKSSEKIPPVQLPLNIIYEDEDLLVINKPAGMPIHPSMGNYHNSVANALAWYFHNQNIPFVFRCVNRLDKDTSGLTIIAKHSVSAGILSQTIHSGDKGLVREYLAISKGTVVPAQGTICAPISRKPDSVIERMVDFENGETAITHYRVLKQENNHSLISLTLETGRTHQIRVHMKYLGFPLIGDYLYNPDTEWIDRQALHSYRICFTHPVTGERMSFTAPLPNDMNRIISI